MMRSARARTVLSIVFFAAVVAASVWYVNGHREAFRRILEIEPESFAVLSALCLLSIWVSGLQISVLVRIFNVRLRGWEAFGLSAVNTMGNFYFTKAGMAAKGVYLKRKHDFSYTLFLSTLAGAYVVSLVTYGVVGCVLYLWSARGADIKPEAVLIFCALIAGGLMPLALPKLHKGIERFVPEKVTRVMDGWQQVRRHHASLLTLSALYILYIVVGGVRLYVAYDAVGYTVAMLPCIVISALQTVLVVFTITPGAVGIRQALVGYGSDLLDIGATEGIVASTIDHGVGTLYVFIVGVVFTNWIWVRHVASSSARKRR